MQYTESEDGVMRATIWLPLRLTREQFASAKRMAAENGRGDWRLSLSSLAALSIEQEIWEFDTEHSGKD
jgi:hypothetical protein